MTHKPRHRHFVAVPAFALFVGLVCALHTTLTAEAEFAEFTKGVQTIDSGAEKRTVLLPGHRSVILEPNARVTAEREGTSLRIVRGEVLVESPGVTTMQLYDTQSFVQVLASRVYMIADTTSTTIIPIHSPVLVYTKNTVSLLLPGRQMRFGSDGTQQEFAVPASWEEAFLGFSDVRVPNTEEETDVIAAAFRDTSHVREILLATTTESPALSALAALTLLPTTPVGDVPSQDALIETLFSDFAPDVAVQALPQILLRSPFQISDSLLDAWKLRALRTAAFDPVASSDFLARVVSLPEHLSDAGYPRQAKQWSEALRTVLTVTSSLIPEDQARALQTLYDSVDDFAVIAHLPSTDLQAQIPEKPKTHFTEKELLSRARNLLLMHEAMVGAETKFSIHTEDDQSVFIENFYIAEGDKDVHYNCVYTPGSNQISSIEREDVLLPNSLTADQFFH